MAESDLATCYNIEEAFEEGVRTVLLASADLGLPVYTPKNAAVLERDFERVEVRLTLGAASGHVRVRTNLVDLPDCWEAILSLTLVTKAGTTGDHSAKRGVLRSVLATMKPDLNTDSVMPYHRLNDYPLDTGTTPVLKTDEGFEYSTLTYRVKVNVRPSAWPT